jgi:hypothetical protein
MHFQLKSTAEQGLQHLWNLSGVGASGNLAVMSHLSEAIQSGAEI